MNRSLLFAALAAAVSLCSSGALLPAEYQEVEWIESTGNQYIQTGYAPNANTFGVVMKFLCPVYMNETAIFGSSWSGSANLLCAQGTALNYFANQSKIADQNTNCVITLVMTPNGLGKGDFVLDASDGDTWKHESASGIALSNTSNLQLFGIGGSKMSILRLYRFTITERVGGEQVAVHDYVPCYRCSDGVAGLYDILAADPATAFKTDSNGTVPFLCGENVTYDDKLEVKGEPVAVGIVSPDYGKHGGYGVGAQEPCTASADWTSEDGLAKATCVGYKVYTNGVVSTEGAGNSFTYTHPDCENGAELVWQWEVEYKTAIEGVEDSDAWVKAGESRAFSVDAPEGQALYKWTDENGNSYRGNPLTLTIDAPIVLTPHFGNVVYVAQPADSTTDPESGAGTEESPYVSLAWAVEKASDGDTILLSAGEHVLTDELTIGKALTICGVGPDRTAAAIVGDKGDHRLLILNHPDVLITNLTVDGKGTKESVGTGAGIYIQTAGGVVSDVIVRNCYCNKYSTSGGGISITKNAAALVDSVIVSNCSTHCEGYSGGTALYMAGGLVRNSLFVLARKSDNVHVATGGGTVFVEGGEMLNCTIADNAAPACPGVRAEGTGIVRNCIISGNKHATSLDPKDSCWKGTAECFVNCVASAAINDLCVVEESSFVDLDRHDYTPSPISKAVDGAEVLDWMERSSDILGNPRVSGPKPDIGAVERDATAFSAAFTVANDYGIAPITAKFTVTVINAGAEGVICHWDWNGDGTADYDTEELVCEHLFSDAGASSVRLTVEDKASHKTAVVPVAQTVNAYPRTTYVRSDAQATPVYPYDTWEKAATSVADAVAAAGDGSEVFVSNGVYSVSGEILIDRAMKVHGATGNARDVTLKVTSSAGRSVRLQNASAWVDSMTFTGGNIPLNTTVGNSGYGAGAMIDSLGGTISNCFIHSTKFGYCYSGGGGIYIKGDAGSNALVTDCIVSNCTVNSEGTRGAGLYMSSGTVRNCLFIDNTCKSLGGNTKNGTCYVDGGKLVNCTIVRNTALNCAGVWATGSGVVRNCVIGYNTAETSTDAKHPCWEGTASCFDHCVAGVAINDNCKIEGSGKVFVSAATGDFTLGSASEAVNGGVYEDWMEGAHDLAGNDRVRGEFPDMGAYEADPAVFSASFEADRTQGFYPLAVTFTATAVNAGVEGARFLWDLNGDGEVDETTTQASFSHVFDEPFSGEIRMTAVRISDGTEYLVPAGVTITAAPEVLYVDAACETSKAPYAEPNHAATNVADAVALAIDGCRVVVAEGDHPVSNELFIDKAIVLSGATGRPEDVRLYRKTATGRIIHLRNSAARVESLTAHGGIINMSQSINNVSIGAGIVIDSQGGTVSNCVVHSCKNSNCYSGGSGIGIQAEAGATALVTHCIISNCTSETEGTGGAAVFFKTNVGEVRNSIIVGNKATGTGGESQNGVVRMGGGRLVNCTLVGNVATRSAGVWGSSGEVVNCIIVGNVSENVETDPLYAVLSGSADIFSHCVTDVEVNDSCFVASADVLFKDLEAGDWRLAKDSPARDKGVKEAWMTGATDLWGGARVVGRRPDAGAYEFQAVGFSVIVR